MTSLSAKKVSEQMPGRRYISMYVVESWDRISAL